MAGKILEAHEFTLNDIFCDDYAFEIPQYQRPYSWETEQAVTLVEDLLNFLDDQPAAMQDSNPYFLGSIVLIKQSSAKAEVVDGQQRITTLTILFSVLRSLVPADFGIALEEAIFQKGNLALMTQDQPRLKTRQRDQEFFNKYIQKADQMDALIALSEELNDSQKNMRFNAIAMKNRLLKESPETLQRLVQLLFMKCFLVVVQTIDEDSAYRIFSVMNDRGMDLSATDILKSLITSKITEQHGEQTRYTNKWEDIEENLGRDEFNSLFAHIRMIEMRAKSRSNLVADFKQHIKPTENPIAFIEDKLIPYSNAYSEILNQALPHENHKDALNKILYWLNAIDNQDWIPAAIYYIAQYRHDGARLARFLTELERLAAVMMICRVPINKRLMRYKGVLDAIDQGTEFDASPLQLTTKDKQLAKTKLNGDLYFERSCSKVLLRLDSSLSDGTAIYDLPRISIEHVMPQNLPQGSQWQTWCPDQDLHQEWVHRLGNLALLSRNKNSAAKNYDFEKKKYSYFSQNNESTPFILTNQIIEKDSWTLDIIQTRQVKLFEKLCEIWHLND